MVKLRITKDKAPWPEGAKVGDVLEMPSVPAWAVGKCEVVGDDAPQAEPADGDLQARLEAATRAADGALKLAEEAQRELDATREALTAAQAEADELRKQLADAQAALTAAQAAKSGRR